MPGIAEDAPELEQFEDRKPASRKAVCSFPQATAFV
jgi:hypothetical protein